VLAAAVITGGCSALIAATITAPVVLPAFWLIAVVGTGLAIVDIRHQRLPHILTGPLWAACTTCFLADAINKHEAVALVRACVVATAMLGLLLLVAIALPGQLGLGDVNLAGVLAFSLAWVGLVSVMTGIAAGLVLQAMIALLAVRLRRTARREMAMGPSLLVGWLLAVTVVRA
jgi:leader peptidase (prepilin peptidase) / N-methyltransferase